MAFRRWTSWRANSPQIAEDDYEVKDQRIYIRADGELEYRNVVRVMNRLQDRGFTKIGLVNAPADSK